jgi:glycosyltransferase involved in cell wall biosynthesis
MLVYDAPVMEEYTYFNGPMGWYKNIISKNQQISLEKSEKIVCYSNPVKKYVTRQAHVLPHHVFIHQNIDFSRFGFYPVQRPANTLDICFVGSFLKWHHADFMVRFAAETREEFPQLRIYMVGEGQQWQNCVSLAKELGANDRVIFTGYLDGAALEECKKKCRVGIMPGSNWYGAPNKIFEYGAAGMAVLAPSTPTITDLFPPESGLVFFENGNFADFRQKLRELLTAVGSENYSPAEKINAFIRKNYSDEKTLDFYRNIFT